MGVSDDPVSAISEQCAVEGRDDELPRAVLCVAADELLDRVEVACELDGVIVVDHWVALSAFASSQSG